MQPTTHDSLIRSVIATVILVIGVSFATLSARAEDPAGTLFIVGGGNTPNAIREAFFQRAGGSKAKIIVVPTASEGAERKDADEQYLNEWQKLKPASVTLLHTRDRKKADEAEFVQPLKEATAVWFSGGNQNRVTAAYLGTAVEKECKALLKRGGVLGGTSAGAALQSKVMIAGGAKEAETAEGFGFIDWAVVDQHFLKRNRMQRLLGVLDKNPKLWGIGVDESTAAVVTGNNVEVVGSSYVVVIPPDRKAIQTLKAGDKLEKK
jgi:cyanophycinase